MKHLALITLLLHAALASAQQTDTVISEIRTEQGMLERQRIVNPYDEVFGIHQPARWLFKWDVAGFLPALGFDPDEYDFTDGGLRFDIEWKPGTAFSLNASYQLGLYELLSDAKVSTHSFRIEPRWYFGMRKRIQRGRGASNLSGNYLGVELTEVRKVSDVSPFSLHVEAYRGAMLRFGMQRRLFRHGFFDISYGVGVRKYVISNYNRGQNNVYSEARVAVGFALSQPKPNVSSQASAYCEVLQCFREERRMFKIDLYNLFRIISTDALTGTARIALEQKIGYSPFSVGLEGRLGGYYSEVDGVNGGSIQKRYHGNYGVQLQTRYYYGQKRRIATGKSGNNLSGAYLAWQADWWHGVITSKSQSSPGGDIIIQKGKKSQLATGLLWGVQYRLFQRGFIDFNLGGGWGRNFYGDLSSGVKDPVQLHVMGGLRVGLAF
ncbi:MAG: hypothetical protein L6Q97_17230 [Thermoanaerobaculia bacterium]|nr:hypothetical protein [Thermoanaerobaculia bacterium]